MIRYGPAAAPRWFDPDVDRFEEYLELLVEEGATAIEFVVLPGAGSEELGRVHLLEPSWYRFVDAAHRRSLLISLHAPLPAEYRLIQWRGNPEGFPAVLAPVLNLLNYISDRQADPPVLVMHGASQDPVLTRTIITSLLQPGDQWIAALELRTPLDELDQRFDRDLNLLAAFVDEIGDPRIGICWDLAHDWERNGTISIPTDEQLRLIRHIHLHDDRPDGSVHGPLGQGSIPWIVPIRDLALREWRGSITVEIRYRYASEIGEPWNVLRESLNAVREVLVGE